MSGLLEEATITCPWCWEEIVVLVDTSTGNQQYVEDCQVCCNPIEISVMCDAGTLHGVEAGRSE
ncbi:MAG: CPXCG motif-containing cysteine-rich protein [Gammaproteobacteria bacterium]|nr:CPXCG motif-containing cysteine-rich protein [Gammaproteobacteria bacterium]